MTQNNDMSPLCPHKVSSSALIFVVGRVRGITSESINKNIFISSIGTCLNFVFTFKKKMLEILNLFNLS